MGYGLPAIGLAVRLADEGVPLRAIARALKISSEDIRIHLAEAKDRGVLVSVPCEDWPPGFPRDQRALQLSRVVSKDPGTLLRNIQKIFDLRPAEAKLMLDLIQKVQVSKFRDDEICSSVNVYICRIRKALEAHGIEIHTLWGYGYQMQPADRRKVMDLLLAGAIETPLPLPVPVPVTPKPMEAVA